MRLWLLATILFLVLPSAVLVPTRALAQSASQPAGSQQLKTKYFTIYYPSGEQDTANWYASFIDDVDAAVSEMLGADPVGGLTLSIYDTEADYIAANPAAGSEPGIMAHSVPSKKEVGVAVERLRQVDADVARQSFRHEMTHIVAGALSNQNLPVGLQEGLAQYNELSISRAQESAQALDTAIAGNVPLFSWTDLNDQQSFMSDAALAYPESYSVMAFLADKYGMGDFAAFMQNLRNNVDWPAAMAAAYGKSADQLQAEWRDYLPGFLKEGWQQNLLAAYDLSPGVALYDAGRFKEAAGDFALSQKLYSGMGRADRMSEATDYLARAQKADGAATLAADARKALEAYDYKSAHDKAAQALDTFTGLGLKDMAGAAGQTAGLAQSGLDASVALHGAQAKLDSFNLPGAQGDALTAARLFAKLGDAPNTEQANRIVQQVSGTLTVTGLIAAGLGLLVLLVGSFFVVRSLRRRRMPQHPENSGPTPTGEEGASWL
jgi:hypothetical protein